MKKKAITISHYSKVTKEWKLKVLCLGLEAKIFMLTVKLLLNVMLEPVLICASYSLGAYMDTPFFLVPFIFGNL